MDESFCSIWYASESIYRSTRLIEENRPLDNFLIDCKMILSHFAVFALNFDLFDLTWIYELFFVTINYQQTGIGRNVSWVYNLQTTFTCAKVVQFKI